MDIIKLLEEAIVAEQAAQERYRKGADAANNTEIRAMFEQLLHWEEGHEEILKEKLKTLKMLKDL